MITSPFAAGVSLTRMAEGSEHIPVPDSDENLRRYGPVLGSNVERLREQGRIHKNRFALMVGIGRPFLDKIERGEANVKLDVLVSLADALGTTPAELLTPHEAPEAPTTPASGHAKIC